MESTSPPESPIDRYVVLEYLAEGGMGAIYLGKKMGAGGFEKQVVLKQLLPEFTRQPEFIDLFLREARLSATLDHANIIHTIDLVTAGEDYFIVMEYLDGADLRTLLRRCKKKRRRLSPAAGLYVARELLSALAYAHNKVGPDGVPLRLIHRDISPSNILISGSGEVKLTDFGIAKASTHNSVFYRVKGKVGYMSPEQAKSEPLDARSDLYSLAVCLYEMITGERLFVNVGLTTSADEMYSQPVPLISHKVQGLPPELDKVMLKALSRDPDHRYQTAGEFQEALLRCAHRHGLMMSAPDLSEHLRAMCGDQRSWRDEGGEHTGALGTELYEMEDGEEGSDVGSGVGSGLGTGVGTDQIDVGGFGTGVAAGEPESDSDLSLAVAAGGQLLRDRDRRRRRARTSITKLTELRGLALTSMINLAGTSPDHAGASPLIDFNDLAQSPMLPSTTGMMRAFDPGALGPGGPVPQGPGPGGYPPGPESYPMAPSRPPLPGPQPLPHAIPHPNPALQPQVQSQIPLGGSLAHIDPLEQTGIIVEPANPERMRQRPMYRDPDDSDLAVPVQGFYPPRAPAAMSSIGGNPVAGPAVRVWAAMAPAQRPLLLLVIILLVGVGTAAVIGLSGPTVEAGNVPTLPAASATSSGPGPGAR
ncbi:MAG TPA: serine/threonine-protein kinase [Candidatus Acidoferrum sp.]|nr:serine/threonine-protein kinase [Candidatus Acidoferrum sp.]